MLTYDKWKKPSPHSISWIFVCFSEPNFWEVCVHCAMALCPRSKRMGCFLLQLKRLRRMNSCIFRNFQWKKSSSMSHVTSSWKIFRYPANGSHGHTEKKKSHPLTLICLKDNKVEFFVSDFFLSWSKKASIPRPDIESLFAYLIQGWKGLHEFLNKSLFCESAKVRF